MVGWLRGSIHLAAHTTSIAVSIIFKTFGLNMFAIPIAKSLRCQDFTLPEILKVPWHLKMDAWNTISFPFGAGPIFQGLLLLVSGSVYSFPTSKPPMSKFQARQDVKSKMLWIHGGQSAQAALGALGDFWNSNVLSTTVTSSLTSTVMTVSSTHTSTATFTEAWAMQDCNGGWFL